MKRNLLLIGAMCLIAAMAFSVFNIYRYFNPYLDREIMGPVTITSEWLEIVPKEPLRAERQVQYLTLDIAEPLKPDYDAGGMRSSDGTLITPEVQLVDQNGKTYPLNHTGVDQKRMVFFMPGLPKDRVYRAVRIRSDKLIKVSKIYWRCYNQWDVS